MSDKRKILILIDWFKPGYRAGGPVRSCVNLVECLGDEFDFWVATRDTDYGGRESYSGIESDRWLEVNGAHIYYFSRSNLNARNLRRLMTSRRFDVLYLNHMFSFYFTIVPLLMKWISKSIPVVLAPRGMLFKEALREKRLKKSIYLALAKLFGLYRGVAWHAASREEQEEIKKHFGRAANVHLAENLAGSKNGKLAGREKIKNELKLIYLARIHPHKNLAATFDYLSEISEDKRVEYDIYGPVEDRQYWNECRRKMQNLPSHVCARYRGEIAPEAVSAALCGHHFLILPTRSESFGHVILEALRAGCPVVTTDQTPWKELGERKAGWCIPLARRAEFISALETCVSMDQDEYRKYSEAAFEYAQSYVSNPRLLEENRILFGKGLEPAGNE